MDRRSLTQAFFPRTHFANASSVTPRVVAFCGGGGKTTLMYALAHELTALGVPVICSTTTRLFPPHIPDEVLALYLAETHDLFSSMILERSPVLVAERLLADSSSPKLMGLSPQILDALADRFPAAVVLVEADGAAQKPLKAPLPHEPVFPSSTSLAIAVVGLDAIAQPLTHATTHRLDQLCALTGQLPGQLLTSDALTTLAAHERGWFQHCPIHAQRVIFANKADAWPMSASLPQDWLVGSAREGWCL